MIIYILQLGLFNVHFEESKTGFLIIQDGMYGNKLVPRR